MNPIDHRMVVAVLGALSQIDQSNAKALTTETVNYNQVFYSPKAHLDTPKPWYREHGNKRRIYK